MDTTDVDRERRVRLPPLEHIGEPELIERFERRFIVQAIERNEGNITRAAEEMGMYRQQLQQKLSKFAIDPADFRRRSQT